MLYEWPKSISYRRVVGRRRSTPDTLPDVQEQYLPSVLAQESSSIQWAEWRADWVCPVIALLLEAGTDGGEEKPIQVRGIDQSLANASQLGKGLGTKLVRALVELLFNDPEVTKIQTDPSPSNLRERSDATRKRGLRGKVP